MVTIENTLVRVNPDQTKDEVKIGDKIAYKALSNSEKEYTHLIDYTQNGGTSSSNNQTLKTEEDWDTTWRVLGVNEKGQLELIRSKAPESTIYLRGEKGYLNAEAILNTTCNELYGKGKGAESARSLNINDINKLAGVLTEEDRKSVTTNSWYGTWWRYRYDTASGVIQYSYSKNYNPETKDGIWEEYKPNGYGYGYFKEPGKAEINSTNPNAETEMKETVYSYNYYGKIKQITFDKISLLSIIDNEWGGYGSQWLASTFVDPGMNSVDFGVTFLTSSTVSKKGLAFSYSSPAADSRKYRPIVTLKNSVKLEPVLKADKTLDYYKIYDEIN